jgi:hypothetical protein
MMSCDNDVSLVEYYSCFFVFFFYQLSVCKTYLTRSFQIILQFMASISKSEHERHCKKENFLRQFRDEKSKEFKQLTATQFMDVWSHYDLDGNI